MKNKYKVGLIFISAIVLLFVVYVLYFFNYIPHQKYSNSDFNITTYKSLHDEDDDGIDDQTDILNNVKAYVSSKPKYKSKYYETGYPDDEYGVCTDVVANGLKDAGYDLKELVNEEMSFTELDNFMMENGYYSVFDDGVTADIKQDGNVVYTATDSNECEVQIFFDITTDNGEDEAEEAFYLKVTDVQEF